MNSVNLTGNICNDLELKSTETGKSVMNFNIAVKRPFSTDVTDFIPLVVWNQPAEFLSKYAKKGSKIAVSGKLTTRKFQDKEGNNRTAYEVVCDAVEILDSRTSNEQTHTNGAENQQPTTTAPAPEEFVPVELDEPLPF